MKCIFVGNKVKLITQTHVLVERYFFNFFKKIVITYNFNIFYLTIHLKHYLIPYKKK